MVQPHITYPSRSSGSVKAILPFICLLLVIVFWAIVCLLSRQPDALTLPLFLGLSGGMMLCSIGILWHYYKLNRSIPFRWILLSAIILRLISLIGEPLFEDDYYRYMWDGYQTATTNDPYTLAPEVFFDRDVPEIFEPILSFINYPNVATVYGPVTQWLFAVGYYLEPAEVWPLQLLASMADLLVLFVLFKLGAGNALLLYAWSPLLLKEFSLTAHPDIYAILGLVLSVYAAYKHRAILAGIAIALACGSKVFAILALPYLLSRSLSIRYWSLFCSSFLICLAAITAFFGDFRIWAPEGLMAMADSWLFNAPLYLLLLNILEFQNIKILLLLLFVGYGLVVFYRRIKNLKQSESAINSSQQWRSSPAGFRGDWLYGLFLLSLPVLNPWYVAWLLPFATLYVRLWSWTASYVVLLSYWYGSNISGGASASGQLENNVVVTEYALLVSIPVLMGCIAAFSRKWEATGYQRL